MAFGIQITKSDNASLLNSFWLLDEANQQARCLCVKDNAFEEGHNSNKGGRTSTARI